MQTFAKLTILLFIATGLQGQDSEIDRLIESELKMTFPSIYFKHQSTDYATMPYTVDSCFKYIALHFDDNNNSLVIWRDSNETKELTNKRIKKLKMSLNKRIRDKSIEIHSMGNQQKISWQTMKMTSDSAKIKYLWSLNSVFDISMTRFPKTPSTKASHVLHPKIWCWNCWRNGFHLDKNSRTIRKMTRRNKQTALCSDLEEAVCSGQVGALSSGQMGAVTTEFPVKASELKLITVI